MKVTMMLADHAAVAEGKLWIAGGGWSTLWCPSVPTWIAILLAVPWDRTNTPLNLDLQLVDEDGAAVSIMTVEGPAEMTFRVQLEVGRPAGVALGTDIEVPVALPVPSLDLPEGRYTWIGTIDGEAGEDRRLTFSVERSRS